MNQHMFFKGITLSVSLAAQLANVRFLARVTQHVAFQVVGPGKTLPAHVANVGFLAGVDGLFVLLQAAGLVESREADVTHVRFLTGVNQLVPGKVAGGSKWLEAFVADVRVVGVVPHFMSFEDAGLAKGLSTQFTHMVLLSCVCQLMGLQV